jgi:sugar/nucleoside kinase (ribokinase family)
LGTKTELEELISYTDLFISCQEGARELTGKEEPLEMAAALREKYLIPNIVISSDSDGCFIATEKEIFHSPAFTIERVDTLGADDAFSAGIVFGFFKGWNIREIARFGNACKAMNSLKKGPRGGMTSEAEVREFIAQYVS